MELHKLVETVSDERSFLAFVDALLKDRELAAAEEKASSSGADELPQHRWENVTIEAFLEAAHAWAKDSDFGARQGLKAASPWKKFAVFLYCGKMYE
ncbi:MAG TPA: hypothetical protein VGD69_09925 [Herpetosiphonaceae bacterium]